MIGFGERIRGGVWGALKRLSPRRHPPPRTARPAHLRLAAPAFAAALAATLLFLLPGCSSSSSTDKGGAAKPGTVQISFLTMQLSPTFNDYFNSLIQGFEKTHPGVHVKWLDYPFMNYETKLMTSFMGSDPPDVINLSSDTTPMWARSGSIQPLAGLVPKGTLKTFVPRAVKEGCVADGKVYALPWYMTSVVAMANKKIFEEAGLKIDAPPKYYNDLPQLCKIIKEKTGKFGYFPLYTEAGSMKGWIMDAGLPVLSPDGKKAVFYTPAAVKIVKFWTDLYKEGLVPSEALTAMHRRPIELYKSGRLAILHSGTEFLRQIKSDAPDVYANTLIGPQMQWKGRDIHLLQFHTIAIAAKSKHPKLAGEFAAYLTDAKNQLAFCKLTTIIPSSVEALKNPYFTQPENTKEGVARKYAAQQVMNGRVIRPPRDQKKLQKAMDDVTEAICQGNMTADEGVKKAAEEWTKILSGGQEK